MRNGKWGVGVFGGFALLGGACYEGPDWPPSVATAISHTGGQSSSTDGGVVSQDSGFDTGTTDAGDGGLVSFVCESNVSTNCYVYKDVPAGQVQAIQANCGTLLPSCASLSDGCCVSVAAGYTVETCEYGTSAASVQAACTATATTYQAKP